MSDEERKLIIDEDWKSQAQREKEELAKKLAAEKTGQPEAPDMPDALAGEDGAPPQHEPFLALVGSLATQCMFALGVIAPQGGQGQQVMVNLDEAAVTLEMLKTLEEKTEGNLTDEESKALKEAARELERVFAARVQQFQEQAAQQQGVDFNNLKGEHPE